jgi:hypothetical protein
MTESATSGAGFREASLPITDTPTRFVTRPLSKTQMATHAPGAMATHAPGAQVAIVQVRVGLRCLGALTTLQCLAQA